MMETIEQLRSDPRPLVSLGKASVVTGEPIGNILSLLAEKDTPLFLKRPEEVRIFCVSQSSPMPFREATYPKVIISPPRSQNPSGFIRPKRGDTHIDASQFNYLVLASDDYRPLTERDSGLSVKLFRQAAYSDKGRAGPTVINASDYYREHLPKASPLEKLQAKFACYSKDREIQSALNFTRLNINPEELFVLRTSLLDCVTRNSKKNTPLPSELTKHLQPWKSKSLHALNIAAYKLYSDRIEAEPTLEEIRGAISYELLRLEQSPANSILQLVVTLLRINHDQQAASNHLQKGETHSFPSYFPPKLIYLNLKCKFYYENQIKTKPLQVKKVAKELTEDGFIAENTALRIASWIIPVDF